MIDKTVYNNVNEYIAVKNMKALADKAKTRELPKNKVLDEINKKLPITEN